MTAAPSCPDRAPNSVLGYCPCSLPQGHDDAHRCTHGDTWPRLYPLADFTGPELATLLLFDAAPAAPESFVRQHRSGADCYCGPVDVGQDAWQHRRECPGCGDLHDTSTCEADAVSCDCCAAIHGDDE